MQYAWRCGLGFGLGILVFVPLMLAGEKLGIVAGLVFATIYLFGCQFLLSIRTGSNIPIMVALDTPILLTFLLVVFFERPAMVWAQGLPLLLLGCGSTLAGAMLAVRVPRRGRR